MIDIYAYSKVEEIEMGCEETCGKYPTITFKLEDNSKITFRIRKEGMDKLKEFLEKYEIKGNRYYDRH